ncbi:HNH endonuclease [Mycolicibacterium sp. Dal123E01]|uniref:HNH endonuclease n=1 Tax=Mycolicibacterium sp. Dal123E01 TaxID=3457578 RepID=UPI00403E72BD
MTDRSRCREQSDRDRLSNPDLPDLDGHPGNLPARPRRLGGDSDVNTKTCTVCGQAESLAEFYRAAHASNGHTSACKGCMRARSRNYYWANRTRELARRAEYRRAHRDQIAEYGRSFPHRKWVGNYRARCRLYGLVPVVEPFDHDDLTERHGDRCVYCGGPFECIDHAIAVAAGGPHTLANVVPCCETCNRIKLSAIDLPVIRLIRSGTELAEAYELVAA